MSDFIFPHFSKSGQIEAWGRGFDKIKDACDLYNGPLPEYEINESGVMVLCKACPKYLELLTQQENQAGSILNVPVNVPVKVGVTESEIINELQKNPHSSYSELADLLGVTEKTWRLEGWCRQKEKAGKQKVCKPLPDLTVKIPGRSLKTKGCKTWNYSQ